MTAIGFVLIVSGFVCVRIFGSPFPVAMNKADWLGAAIGAAGFVMFVAGLAVYLWRGFP